MIRQLVLMTSLIVIPSVAVAQRGGRSQADKKTELFDKTEAPKGPALRVRDLEDMSPLKLIIDKRKDLKLTDAQVASFKEAENKLKEKNAPTFKAVDSLLRDMRPGTGDEDRVRSMNARAGMAAALDGVYANYDAAAKDAVAMLDAEQQTKANEMIAKQREEAEKTIQQKMRPPGDNRRQPPLG